MKKNFFNLLAVLCHVMAAAVLIYGFFKVENLPSKIAFLVASVFLVFSALTFLRIYKSNRKK